MGFNRNPAGKQGEKQESSTDPTQFIMAHGVQNTPSLGSAVVKRPVKRGGQFGPRIKGDGARRAPSKPLQVAYFHAMPCLPVLKPMPTLLFMSALVILSTQCRPEEDPHVVPEIRFPIDISKDETEANSTFEFPIVLNQSTSRDIMVHYETRELTALEGEDYIPVADSLVIPAGTATASIFVDIVVDDYMEEDEEFRVVLTGSSNATFAGGIQEAISTIRNDDSLFPISGGGYMSASSYPGKTLVWSDEFDAGSIDLSNWTYDLGANGWGNQELQNYTSNSENSYVDDGHLFIVARDEGTHYTSARMKSIGLQEFQYGRIDVRAILPKGQGIWPAIWMLGANFPTSGWPACGEMDIMELIGSSPNTVHGTVHYGADWTQHNYTGGGTSIPWTETFSDEFHVFSIDWTPSGITWLLDDQPFYSVDNAVTGSQPYPFDNPFFFILNIAVGGQWPGYPDATTAFPQFMAVDYVRVFQ
ncbi:MAG: glycosyl hydrolase family protein [Crocinitomicaceae bacterium TMED114]|nr:MAG: glycosyl hydrolase family protein [Crocinitomicaceae bacterium TMED114]